MEAWRGDRRRRRPHSGGKIVQGNFASTHFRNELPPDSEVFEEAPGSDAPFEHVWEFDLPRIARSLACRRGRAHRWRPRRQ